MMPSHGTSTPMGEPVIAMATPDFIAMMRKRRAVLVSLVEMGQPLLRVLMGIPPRSKEPRVLLGRQRTCCTSEQINLFSDALLAWLTFDIDQHIQFVEQQSAAPTAPLPGGMRIANGPPEIPVEALADAAEALATAETRMEDCLRGIDNMPEDMAAVMRATMLPQAEAFLKDARRQYEWMQAQMDAQEQRKAPPSAAAEAD